MRGYLLDTNVTNPNVLAWFQAADEDDLFLSVLVVGEIRSGIERIRPSDPAQARVLDHWLKGLEATYIDRVLPVTAAVADRWGRLSAINPPSVIDCLIAATALESDLTLVTRNIQDLARTGVRLLNPFDATSA